MTRLQPQLKVHVSEDSRAIFGDAEVRLLEAIAHEGTLTEGAARLGLSYRSAWGKLRALEGCLGARLVDTTVGGSGGGSSRLTPLATELVTRYSAFRSALGSYAVEEFERCFGQEPSCSKLVLTAQDHLRIPEALNKIAAASEANGEPS